MVGLVGRFSRVVMVALVTASASCTQAGDEAAPSDAPVAPLAPPAPAMPTWYRDVEPIVQGYCTECHTTTGAGGFPMTRATTKSLASFIERQLLEGNMPPWPVSPKSPTIQDARLIPTRDVAIFVDWVAAGAPLGDPSQHVDRPPRAKSFPPRPPDVVLVPEDPRGYVQPASPFVTDEVRCFVMATPSTLADARVTAARFIAGKGSGIHNMGAVVVDAAAAAALRTRNGTDGRAGFECGGGLGDSEGILLGGHDTGSGPPAATILPKRTAVTIPTGGAVVLRVHYGVKHLAGAPDRSTIALWVAPPNEAASLHPLERLSLEAPVEVPCPTGIATDPSSPCSREGAFAQFASVLPADAMPRADALLAKCGTSLTAMASKLAFTSGSVDHFVVPTSCTETVPFDARIHVVRPQLLTRGASVRVEAEQPDGEWKLVIFVPKWRWGWAGAYVFEDEVLIHAGRGLRVSCTFDNGVANQWSAKTGEPGHGGPARAPWLPPRYLIGAPHRAAERCAVDFAVERR